MESANVMVTELLMILSLAYSWFGSWQASLVLGFTAFIWWSLTNYLLNWTEFNRPTRLEWINTVKDAIATESTVKAEAEEPQAREDANLESTSSPEESPKVKRPRGRPRKTAEEKKDSCKGGCGRTTKLITLGCRHKYCWTCLRDQLRGRNNRCPECGCQLYKVADEARTWLGNVLACALLLSTLTQADALGNVLFSAASPGDADMLAAFLAVIVACFLLLEVITVYRVVLCMRAHGRQWWWWWLEKTSFLDIALLLVAISLAFCLPCFPQAAGEMCFAETSRSQMLQGLLSFAVELSRAVSQYLPAHAYAPIVVPEPVATHAAVVEGSRSWRAIGWF